MRALRRVSVELLATRPRQPRLHEHRVPRRNGRTSLSYQLMKISIILAHPTPGSFTHAIATTAADALRQSGYDVILHDLCREQFQPLLTAAELQKDARLD